MLPRFLFYLSPPFSFNFQAVVHSSAGHALLLFVFYFSFWPSQPPSPIKSRTADTTLDRPNGGTLNGLRLPSLTSASADSAYPETDSATETSLFWGRRRFVYKTLSQRIDDIDINVFRSLDKIKSEPSKGPSFLRDCLIEWREFNTAEDFILFYGETMLFVQTLPLPSLEIFLKIFFHFGASDHMTGTGL
ncbi:hypothetical protein V6N12_012598 [Hibiscus sabdariffa]|uniref:Uncharacterized protein n=1 Tax=Hibiscus sabdariffa TaxID=183260 RepID=A0ABR2DDZ7_9ROSI